MRATVVVLSIVAAFSLSGCSGAAAVARATAKDPASWCFAVSSVYVNTSLIRANSDGLKASASNGKCELEHSTAPSAEKR